MALEPPSISQITGAAILDGNMEKKLSTITSSSSTIDDVGEGSYTSTHYMYLHHLHHGPPQDHQTTLWWPNHQTRYPNWITTKYHWPCAHTNLKIYPVIYGYRQLDHIGVMTVLDFQGTWQASKLACLLAYSLLRLSCPLALNLPASPRFATRNKYSTQPHSWAMAQLIQPAHHNKSKVRSPLARSSIFDKIPNPP